MSTALDDVIAKSRALLAAVDFDNNGNVVGMARMGGNGGLLSIDTTKAGDALRLAFDRLRAEPQPIEVPDIKFAIADYLELRDESLGFVSDDAERAKSAIELHDAIQVIHAKIARPAP